VGFVVRGFAILIAALMIGAAAPEPSSNDVKYINVLTGDMNGVYYTLGLALSQIYVKAIPDARVSVQASQGSIENLKLLQQNRAEVAFALGATLSRAWWGDAEAGFTVPLKKLRTVAAMYPNYIHVVARADAGIKTFADLKGKRILVGRPSSGTELNVRALLKAADLTYADFERVEYGPFSKAMELMKRGQIDVAVESAGLGVMSVRDLAAAVKVVLVPIPADLVKKIDDCAYQSGKIPAKTYPDQLVSVPIATVTNFLVTHEDVPEDMVYDMTRSMMENLDQLTKAHAVAKAIKPEKAGIDHTVPLHPGAERYYREAGLL